MSKYKSEDYNFKVFVRNKNLKPLYTFAHLKRLLFKYANYL